MKVVQINSVCEQGSTGKIAVSISELLTNHSIENYILYACSQSKYGLGIKYSNDFYIKIQAMKSRIIGNYGFNSIIATLKLIKKLKKIDPDIIHLHNIHSHDLNLEYLFKYIKSKNIKVVWTFHDCWAFTGYCTYFDMVGCEKWKYECSNCQQRSNYTWIFDRSNYLFNKKKRILVKGLDMTIVTPSHWLAKKVRQSFLGKYDIKVINNGIDLQVFNPKKSVKEKYNIEEKYIILGVGFEWGERKGLDVFIELSRRLSNDFVILLVGTNVKIDSKLPENIISIHRTNNQEELAQLYSTADLFVNPTREENYPTVNMEALACGTPVLTFDTGGSAEIIDETCGKSVPKNDIDALEKNIIDICINNPYTKEACLKRARVFDMYERFKEYVNLYETEFNK